MVPIQFKSFAAGTFLLLFSLCIAQKTAAQNDIGELIRSGKADAAKLVNAYVDPFLKGFTTDLGSGWYSSAKHHRVFLFDFRVMAIGALVPDKDRYFDVRNLGLSNNIRLRDPNNYLSPTVAGPSKNGPELVVYDKSNPNQEITSFVLPQGTGIKESIGFNPVPAPMIQATIGLIRHTDLTVRLVPNIALGTNAGNISLWGIGLKHDLLQYLKLTKMLPFDLAVMGGYTQLQYQIPLNVPPDQGATPKSGQPADFSTQQFISKFNAFTANAIVSKKFVVITLYGSVGFNATNANLDLRGNYPVTTSVNALGQRQYEVVVDPVNISSSSGNSAKISVGFQLKLAFFSLYGDFTRAKYSVATLGLGFGSSR